MQARVKAQGGVSGNGCFIDRWSLTSCYDNAASNEVDGNACLHAADWCDFGTTEYRSDTNGRSRMEPAFRADGPADCDI